MDIVDVVLLVFGLGTCARGVYALVTRDVKEDNERIVGQAAAWHGAILMVIGVGVVSHAIFHWPWITALVEWLRRLE